MRSILAAAVITAAMSAAAAAQQPGEKFEVVSVGLVIGVGSPVVPGGIVCADYATVTALYQHYNRAWRDEIRESQQPGATMLYGRVDRPRPSDYGCRVAKPGTKATAYWPPGVPVMVVEYKAGGKLVKGATMPALWTKAG
ncbi:hypothetical protein Sp245p_26255 (plasmid) [Azospirillum baldaniorum]|uniref:Uncharacterized protein n=1 Tax=Azospirillum baldaniorum TaxID=1064539 RepID=A0A9P1NR93_9PROT|nr:hypothetical protein [Azospirillum baldaniorum]AWJ93327.1 hypothetical protein Sp245p_26255 [Azospirillum baldaniorum]TWA78029.1 hypothetical protein FBZ85_106189 [Azospirillum brasilense]CCD02869.1 exported protein of unknown function [Azospirillum baldaniorum]